MFHEKVCGGFLVSVCLCLCVCRPTKWILRLSILFNSAVSNPPNSHEFIISLTIWAVLEFWGSIPGPYCSKCHPGSFSARAKCNGWDPNCWLWQKNLTQVPSNFSNFRGFPFAGELFVQNPYSIPLSKVYCLVFLGILVSWSKSLYNWVV